MFELGFRRRTCASQGIWWKATAYFTCSLALLTHEATSEAFPHHLCPDVKAMSPGDTSPEWIDQVFCGLQELEVLLPAIGFSFISFFFFIYFNIHEFCCES